jgi:glucose/arabinose dehydrogenase
MRSLALLPLLPLPLLLSACPNSTSGGTGAGTSTGYEAGPLPDGAIKHPCTLPGAVQFTANGPVEIPGGDPNAPSLGFLHLPVGFCAHWYGNVGNVRQMRFAPGGELFVASPTTATTGGGANGVSSIVILPDDNHDGYADGGDIFLEGLPSTQGLLFNGGFFYYQDQTRIMQLPYKAGDRKPSGAATPVVDITVYSSGLHWPKVLDASDDGHIYVGNGGDQGEACVEPHPFHGGILEIDGSPGGKEIARGFRNPIGIRCARGHNQCFALELALDYSAAQGGREKLVPIHEGDDWGFPCCATQGLPYSGVQNQAGNTPNCGGVAPENVAFLIGDTPFGLDFEPGRWPSPYTGSAFVATHGAAGSWTGSRVVMVPMDPSTGLPVNSSDTGGSDQGMQDFATGWDDQTLSHGRAAELAFSPDGRLFVGNDNTGDIFWVAPMN